MFPSFSITPYVGVGPILLGTSRHDIQVLLGRPSNSRTSRFSSRVLDHWAVEGLTITSEHENGTILEVGFGAEQQHAEVNGIHIFAKQGPTVLRALCLLDGSPQEDVGMTVLFKLGMTLTGFLDATEDDRAVTVFAPGVWSPVDPRLR